MDRHCILSFIPLEHIDTLALHILSSRNMIFNALGNARTKYLRKLTDYQLKRFRETGIYGVNWYSTLELEVPIQTAFGVASYTAENKLLRLLEPLYMADYLPISNTINHETLGWSVAATPVALEQQIKMFSLFTEGSIVHSAPELNVTPHLDYYSWKYSMFFTFDNEYQLGKPTNETLFTKQALIR